MQTQRVGPSGARIKLRVMIGEQRPQRRAMRNRIALKILTTPQLRKFPVRRANLRTLEIIQIEIRQQMQSRLDLDDFDRSAAIEATNASSRDTISKLNGL